MNIADLIKAVGVLSDETLPPHEVVGFLNDGIASINTEVNANFPFLDISTQAQEPAFPEKWQRLLLVVFGAAKVKQKDSSQFEYEDLYNQFYDSLSEFKTKYTIPDEFKDVESANNASIKPNFTGAFYGGDW